MSVSDVTKINLLWRRVTARGSLAEVTPFKASELLADFVLSSDGR